MPLLTSWQFRQAGQDKWYRASVPGCVHTDLLNNKLVEDPFYRDNEKKLQWMIEPSRKRPAAIRKSGIACIVCVACVLIFSESFCKLCK